MNHGRNHTSLKGTGLKDAFRAVSGTQSAYDIKLDEFQGTKENPDVVMIDSSKRNQSVFKSPNNYEIVLPSSISRVTSLSLTYAYIPISEYTIQRHNNMFYFLDTQDQIDGSKPIHTISLPHGNYPIEDGLDASIIQELQSRMNAISESNYTVSLNKFTNRITIEQQSGGSRIFRILMAGDEFENEFGVTQRAYLRNSIGHVLGFQPLNLSGKLSYTSQNVYNLTPVPYILMRLTCDGHKLSRMTSNNPSANDCFCPIFLNTKSGHFSYNQDINIDSYRYTFTPLLASMKKIKVEFLHGDGTPYDFNGLDHVLNFEVDKN